MVDSQILEYIRVQLRNGTPKSSILNALSASGWKQEDIAAAFAVIDGPQAAPPPAPAVPPTQSPAFPPPQQQMQTPQMTQPTDLTRIQPAAQPTPRRRKWPWIVGGIVVLLLLLLVVAPILLTALARAREKGQAAAAAADSTNLLAPPDATSTPDNSPYTNTAEGIQITPPPGWATDEGGKLMGMPSIVAFVLSNDSVAVGLISVKSAPAGGLGIDDIATAFQDAESKQLKSYASAGITNTTIGGYPARLAGASFTTSDGVPLREVALIVIKNDKAYVINSQIRVSDWDTYQEPVFNVFKTFKFL